MTARVVKPQLAIWFLGFALLILGVLLDLPDPALPMGGLDPSWMLATEYAADHHLVFGREFVFTFGPYHYLATRLFEPATFPLVLVYGVLSTVALFWTALANRSVLGVAALAACVVLLRLGGDALTAVALFAAFLICLQRRDLWAVLVAALCAPLALAKYSFALVVLPLLLLADLDRLRARRLPVLTPSFMAATLAANLAAHQPIGATGELIGNSLEVILGYGRAMQITGPRRELGVALLLAVAAVAFAAVLVWRRLTEDEAGGKRDWRPLAAAAGFLWILFMLFKMGFVRHDAHSLSFHLGMPAALALLFGFLDQPGRVGARTKWAFAALFVLISAHSLHWMGKLLATAPGEASSASSELGRSLNQVWPRLRIGAGWISGRRFEAIQQAKTQADAALRRRFPATVTGTVDAIPWDVAPLIGSGLQYHPRPVLQSYSSYTPALQALDQAHFQGPDAPETLFLRLEDIDNRLPTLATGPSLPVIAQRYDAVGTDQLGLILKRRAAPRSIVVRSLPSGPLTFDRWVPAPGRKDRLLMARLKVERTLAGRLVGFLFREPLMRIDLRTADGLEASYRLVPDMAQLGVAVSPVPASWEMGAAAMLDPQSGYPAKAVVALRLSTNGKNWAFKRLSVSYEEVAIEPGFAHKMPMTFAGSTDVATLLDSLGVRVTSQGARTPPFKAPIAPADPHLCRGWFDSLSPAPEASFLWRAVGWGWDVADARTFDRIYFVDEAGHTVGAAVGGGGRPDVPPVVPEVRSTTSGWSGAAIRGKGANLKAYGLLKDGRACEVGQLGWPP
jgi:hypothetical protein